uniref:Uncharacterized protein n=1 Tax=Physcomitrium patens TaxID=3218 RepID=A0A2K1K3H4_PHYPA|nr:hypothetical protein PHYPA_012802 [Physcomitrium patens]
MSANCGSLRLNVRLRVLRHKGGTVGKTLKRG